VTALLRRTTAIGTMLDQHNIRREFRRVTEAAGLGSGFLAKCLFRWD